MAVLLGEPLMPHQRQIVEVAGEFDPDTGRNIYREVWVTVPRQSGKGLDVDTPVPTPSGWTPMGDLAVGDELFDEAGNRCRVSYVSPHRLLDCWRVSFSDGTSVVADGDHLWNVFDVWGHNPAKWKESRAKGCWLTAATRDLAGTCAISNRGKSESRYRLPDAGPLDLPDAILPIDPYVLGSWLGDGSSRAAAFTVGYDDHAEAVCLWQAAGAKIVSETDRGRGSYTVRFNIRDAAMRDGFQSRAMRLGVWGNKHIPLSYLRASFSQRLALLQGLMDTDGTVGVNGTRGTSRRCEFCVVNERLARGTLELCRSLGIRVSWAKGRAKICGRDVGPRYRVTFNTDLPVFRLRRKLGRLSEQGPPRKRSRMITGIVPTPTVPTVCIQVDSESALFRCGRGMVPTHNTTLVLVIELDRTITFPLGFPAEAVTAGGLDRPQQVVYTAQTGFDARKKLIEDHVPKLNRSKISGFIDRVLKGVGNESINFINGSTIQPLSSSAEAGHGRTIDLAVADEAFADTTNAREQALLPAMATRPWGQLWGVSTAGTDASLWLRSKVDIGRASVIEKDPTSKIAYFEWSAPEDCDLDDENVWRQTMPALGHTIDLEVVRHARQTMTDNEFARAFLNIWTKGKERVIPVDVWDRVNQADLDLNGPIVLAADADPSLLIAAVAACDRNGNVELIDTVPVGGLVPLVTAISQAQNATVFIDGGGPLAAKVSDLTEALGDRLVRIGGAELVAATGEMFAAIADADVSIRTHPALETAAANARKRKVGDRWAWVRDPDVVPLVATSIAYWARRHADQSANRIGTVATLI